MVISNRADGIHPYSARFIDVFNGGKEARFDKLNFSFHHPLLIFVMTIRGK